MKQVTIHEAKTHLSRLIKEALAGEDIIIANGHNPMVRLSVMPKAKIKRRFGGAKGMIKYMAPDFNDPLEDFSSYMP